MSDVCKSAPYYFKHVWCKENIYRSLWDCTQRHACTRVITPYTTWQLTLSRVLLSETFLKQLWCLSLYKIQKIWSWKWRSRTLQIRSEFQHLRGVFFHACACQNRWFYDRSFETNGLTSKCRSRSLTSTAWRRLLQNLAPKTVILRAVVTGRIWPWNWRSTHWTIRLRNVSLRLLYVTLRYIT